MTSLLKLMELSEITENLQEKNTVSYGHYRSLRQELDEKGVSFRMGKWTKAENELLRKNWIRFFKKHPYPEPTLLLRKTHANKERRAELALFVRSTNFYKKLGKGIHRPIYSIYTRARSMFHTNKTGRFSEAEVKRITELHKNYGNHWTEIGKIVNRSSSSVKDKFRLLGGIVKGKWTAEENEQLSNVIKKVCKCNDLKDASLLIPWEKVAKKMPDRSANQCRSHWFYLMHALVKDPDHGIIRSQFSAEEKITLIQEICNQDVHDENDIDWCSLKSVFQRDPSIFYLKKRWYRLKRKVPNHVNKSLDDILDTLALCVVPKLRKKQSNKAITPKSSEFVDTSDDSTDDNTFDDNVDDDNEVES